MISKVMKRAWEIKREDARYLFGLCLKMAWAEIKEENSMAKGTRGGKRAGKMTTEELAEKFEELGGNRWTKYGKDRIYIKSDMVFDISRYKSGGSYEAYYNGEKVANNKINYIDAKSRTYLDVNDNFKVVTDLSTNFTDMWVEAVEKYVSDVRSGRK